MKRKTWLKKSILILSVFMACLLLYPQFGFADTLFAYVGDGMKNPMDRIGIVFEEKYGIEVKCNYAGSPVLLKQIEQRRDGDCYMPGSIAYINEAKKKGFVDYEKPVAYHTPAIAVFKENPAKIGVLKDLTKPGLKIALGDPKICAIGRVTNIILEKNEIHDEVWKNVVSTAKSPSDLATYLYMRLADVTITWKSSLFGTADKVDIIEIPEEQNCIKVIPIGRLTFSKNKEMAKKFVDFVVSDEGKKIFKECGFVTY